MYIYIFIVWRIVLKYSSNNKKKPIKYYVKLWNIVSPVPSLSVLAVAASEYSPHPSLVRARTCSNRKIMLNHNVTIGISRQLYDVTIEHVATITWRYDINLDVINVLIEVILQFIEVRIKIIWKFMMKKDLMKQLDLSIYKVWFKIIRKGRSWK